jgi:uncharacterized membrane protein
MQYLQMIQIFRRQDEAGQWMAWIHQAVEQKVTKVIALIEELRRDLPSVQNRVDSQAEAIQEVVDPQTVLSALEGMLQEGDNVKEKEKDEQDK